MSTLSVVGSLAMLASLVIIVLGIPAQIIKNYRRKSCDGLAPSLIYSASVTYFLWSMYAWMKPDWFLAVAQTPGCVLSLVLIFQLLRYKKK